MFLSSQIQDISFTWSTPALKRMLNHGTVTVSSLLWCHFFGWDLRLLLKTLTDSLQYLHVPFTSICWWNLWQWTSVCNRLLVMQLLYRQGEIDGIFWAAIRTGSVICVPCEILITFRSNILYFQGTPSNMTPSKEFTPFMKSKESAEKPSHIY